MRKYNNILVRKINQEKKAAEHQNLKNEIAKQLKESPPKTKHLGRNILKIALQMVLICIFLYFCFVAYKIYDNPEMLDNSKDSIKQFIIPLF